MGLSKAATTWARSVSRPSGLTSGVGLTETMEFAKGTGSRHNKPYGCINQRSSSPMEPSNGLMQPICGSSQGKSGRAAEPHDSYIRKSCTSMSAET